MSIATFTDWEIRTTGDSLNGGGFKDLDPGTSVDYSQQDAAQLAVTDIVTASAAVSSATGGFTAAMVGNVICLSGGTGVTKGWYQITGYTDTNNITVDRNAGSSGSGGTGNVGGAWLFGSSENTTFFNSTNKVTYNVCHIKSGTYSGSGVLGTSILTVPVAFCTWRGYDSSRNDTPTLTNRPLLDFGTTAAGLAWSGYNRLVENVQFACQATSNQRMYDATGQYHTLKNCKVTRSGASAYGLRLSQAYSMAIGCDISSASYIAVSVAQSNARVIDCFVHDSSNGVIYTGSGSGFMVSGCVIADITGDGISSNQWGTIIGNTIYNCGDGIYTLYSFRTVVLNNIIQDCTVGVKGGDETWVDHNCFYGNTSDFDSTIWDGPNNIFSDPLMVSPSTGDFTLASGSPCFDAASKLIMP